MPRRKGALRPAAIARRLLLALYVPRHFAMSIAVGLAVAATLWLLRLARHPPLLLKNVPPLAAGLCAGLGVHVARLWLRS